MNNIISMARTIIRLYFLPALLFSVTVVLGQASAGQPTQDAIPIFNSPDGPVILFGGSSINSAGKDNEGVHFVISRTEARTNNAIQLNLPGMVRDMASFTKITGQPFVTQLQHQLKLTSPGAFWSYLQSHPDLSAYGLASFNIPFRIAMGAAYRDGDVKSQRGHTYLYTITADGAGQAATSFSASLTIGYAPDFSPPVLVQSRASDSTVFIRWRASLHRNIPYLAAVYRQTDGRGDFQKLNARIIATHKGDSALFVFTEKVRPNSAYRYFIRPADLLDNAGSYNSDTASLVAVNFRKLPMLAHLVAKDTMNGILLSWKPLSPDPLISGIEIQRSRDPRGDYVVIDTASALAHTYMDRRLLPHIAYYYRLCVLHAGKQLQTEKFYTSVSADQQKTTQTPDAPYGFSAQTTLKGVLTHWQPVSDPDFYAYYVYRGTSLNAKMDVISPGLTDTLFTDTSSNLSRQTNYVYAVTAVSTGSRESPLSQKIAARLPAGKEKPLTPAGIRITPRDHRLFIQWDDVKNNDPGILGYILYKHKTGDQALSYDATRPASAEATRLHLVPVIAGAITVPYYEDTLPGNGGSVEYLVSSIDAYGVESGLSAAASSARFNSITARPPAQVFLRSVKEGVSLQWEQADMQGIAGFVLYRRAVTDKQATKIARVGSAISQFTDTKTTPGTLYVYTITSLTATGESAPGDEHTVRK